MIRWPPDGLEDPSGSQRVPLACPHGCVVGEQSSFRPWVL
jgi:hypothetical protein